MKGIDVIKTSVLRKCVICHNWFCLDKGFKFQLVICNGCYDALKMPVSVNNFV